MTGPTENQTSREAEFVGLFAEFPTRDLIRNLDTEMSAISFGELTLPVSLNEKGKVKSCSNPLYQLPVGKEVVAVDPEYFRPTEVDLLIGDATKAYTKLGWKPKYDLAGLVKEMVAKDIELA